MNHPLLVAFVKELNLPVINELMSVGNFTMVTESLVISNSDMNNLIRDIQRLFHPPYSFA